MTPSTSTALRAVPAPTEAIRAKFIALGEALRTEILESDERIDGALTALVAGEHMAQIGPPGTAKTYLVDRIVARITGVRYFDELMRKTMSPELVYGTQSIIAMKNDDPVRFITDGMMPDCDIAQLDEFPRTSDAILNGLLKILNERRFKNGADYMDIPLSTAFLNANSLPVGEVEHDLEAFWDRVVMRFMVELPKERSTWRALITMNHDPKPPALLDWSDVLTAKAEATALPLTEDAVDAIQEIQERLFAENITITPRRCRQAQKVCQAWAWLSGADEVRREHGEMLTHMLWDDPEQRLVVDRIVSEVVSPMLRTAVTIADTIEGWRETLDAVLAKDMASRTAETNELFAKFVAQREELDEFLPTATGRALRTADAASRQLDSMQAELVGSMGVNLKALRNLKS